MKRPISLIALIVALIFIGCGGVDSESSGGSVSTTNTKTISGYVEDDPVEGAEVYIDFGDGTISTKAITKSDGSFEIKLSDEDLAKINSEVPEGVDDLLIVAKKEGKILRNAISRDINNTGVVYITNDTEAYAEFLESVGAFDTSALLNFNNELQNGRIKDSSKYAKMIKNLREDVKDYFYGGERITKKAIFEKALEDLNKSELATIADDKNILLARNIVSGGDIILPDDVNVSSDDIAVTPKGNGRYTLGDGSDTDKTIYLKISKSDGTFALIPVNIKSQTITEVAKRAVTPAEGATLGSDDNVKVVIPPFALNETKEITIKKIETEGESADGKKILDLEPHGTQFQVPITIKINYADFGIDDPYAVQWKYGSLDEGYDDADIVSVDTANKVIYLNVDHFSDLVVRKINGQKFLDLGPNFVTVIPARNFKAKLNGDFGDESEGIYNLKNKNVGAIIVTNRIFKGDSFNHKRTFSGQPGGGHCVQTVYILQDLLGKKINTKDANTNINEWKKLSKNEWEQNGWISDIANASSGDVVYSSGGKYGHTQMLIKMGNKYYLTDSNGFNWSNLLYDKRKLQYNPNIGEGSYSLRTRIAYLQIDNSDLMTTNPKKYLFNSKLRGKGWFTREEIIDLINKYRENNTSNWINAVTKNGIELTKRKNINLQTSSYDKIINVLKCKNRFLIKHLNRDNVIDYSQYRIIDLNNEIYKYPYFYYLINENNINNNKPNGIIKQKNVYKYYPNLLPVAPLRVHFDDNGVGQIQNYEDARYEIYAEYKDSATFKTSDGVDLKYSDTNITLPNAFGDNLKLTQLALTQDSNKTSLVMVADKLKRDSIIVSNIDSPIKMLFSPIVIDDYYVNWGKENKNHNIPIGFWNSKGYNLIYKGSFLEDANGYSGNLKPNSIYKDENAINGYFMTLADGESAEWHFTLTGPHAIYVNIPTLNINDIKNAKYTLYGFNGVKLRDLEPIELSTSALEGLEGSDFKGWIALQSTDGNVSFDFTGNEYVKVTADGGTIVVDAIRLESRKDRIERLVTLKTLVDVANSTDRDALMCKVIIENLDNGKKISKYIPFGTSIKIKLNKALNKPLNLKFIYMAKVINKLYKQIGHRSLNMRANEEQALSTKYRPVIQNIIIKSDETTKNIPPVTLQPYGTKESVKLHLINAVDGSAIKDANVSIRYGIDNDNNQSFAYSGTTDENGYFEISNMPYGQYTAIFSKDGFISTSLNMNVDENSNDTYDLSMSPVLTQGEMRIRLSWGVDPSDLDSHLVKYVNGNQEYHIYYNTPNGTNGDNLDRDDTDGYGPETVTIKEINASAKYVYYVYKYAGNGEIKNSGASVKVSYGNSEQTFYPPQKDGKYWKVFTIENGKIIPCTSNCMGDSTVLSRALSYKEPNDDKLFENLPEK